MYLGKQHHVAIICSDWDKTREFYVEKLGFQLTMEAYRPEIGDYLRMLKLGDTVLEVFIKPGYPERVTDPEAKGLRHLAFQVENVETVAAWLNGLGIETEPVRVDNYNGGRFVFFKDPDGLPLEIHE